MIRATESPTPRVLSYRDARCDTLTWDTTDELLSTSKSGEAPVAWLARKIDVREPQVTDVEWLDFPDADQWESWLAAEHTVRSEAWLRIAKRHSGSSSVSTPEALDVALCYGWIDGQRKAHDEVSFLQRYSRRRPRSSWSKVNVAKVEALMAAGRMQPAGLAEVEAAKADGRWDAAYESQRTAEVPPDLTAALAENARARNAFERLGRSDRYAVILPLLKARTPETRARLLARAIARLAGDQ